MALVYLDRVLETTRTSSTGAYALDGPVQGYQAFSTIGNGNTCYYAATDGTNWEVGIGTYSSSANTLSRTSVQASSNGNAAVSWGVGSKNIWLDFPAFVAGYLNGRTPGPVIDLTNGTGLPLTTGVTGRLPLANMAVGSSGLPLVGNGSGSPSYQQLSLTAGITGLLPTVNGGEANCANRAALAALDTTKNIVAYLEESGRQGWFQWSSANLSAAVTADTQQGVYVAPASAPTGASGAWVRQYTSLDARYFGIVGDGVTDDYAALAGAISLIAFKGNGVLDCTQLPVGMAVSQAVTIGNGTATTGSTYSMSLLGRGGGSAFITDRATVLKRINNSGGTVLTFQGPVAGASLLGAWIIDGNHLAANGLILNGVQDGTYPNIKIRGCTSKYLSVLGVACSGAYGGARNNQFGVFATDTVPSGAVGITLDADLSGDHNALQNKFGIIDMPISGAAGGIFLGYADFNEFNIVDIGKQDALTGGYSIQFFGCGPTGNTAFPEYNRFGLLAASPAIITNSTGGTPWGNVCDVFDLPDSLATVPTALGFSGTAYGLVSGKTVAIPFGVHPKSFSTATPALPSGTGVSVTNSNTYPVVVYHNGYSGVHIVDFWGVDKTVPGGTSVNPVILYPGDAIYYSTTVATSWLWYGMA